MKKLVAALQRAHSGELAAYHAYEGHWRSLKSQDEARHIRAMQRDELRHISQIRKFLFTLGAKPNKFRDGIFWIVGKTASVLCYVSGYNAPMYGAELIERFGASEYSRLSSLAYANRQFSMSSRLKEMAAVEAAHEWYLQTRRKK